jgi:hypothetical protein
LAGATEDLFVILQATHLATPFLQQGTVINDAMEQLTKIFTPPNRNETAEQVALFTNQSSYYICTVW